MRVALEGLRKRFDGRTAVEDVTLEVADGELFFLLGPSGCGKTTLLRCVAGLLRPDAGRVWIGTQDATHLPPHQRDCGMVFQGYALWPHLSVRENVAFGLRVRRLAAVEIRARVDAALALVRLPERAEARPGELSGGEQQRVALARALVIRPRCLLLDEPLSNLDARLRLEMRAEIRRICKESGLTALYVTHDQKEALSIADRIALLERGRLVQCGTPQELYQHPRSAFVAQFIGETNFLEGVVEEVGAGSARIRTEAGTVTAAAPPEGLRAGAAVTLSLRPEALRLDPAPPDAPNAFAARLAESVYLGEMAQRELVVGGARLKVYELNPHADGGGGPRRVWFAPEDVIVLPH